MANATRRPAFVIDVRAKRSLHTSTLRMASFTLSKHQKPWAMIVMGEILRHLHELYMFPISFINLTSPFSMLNASSH